MDAPLVPKVGRPARGSRTGRPIMHAARRVARRARQAHANAVENLGVFAPLALLAIALGGARGAALSAANEDAYIAVSSPSRRMSNFDEAFLRRFSGAKIFAGSVVLALAGYMPLQLYIWFGPEDGNPIGLGLLALATLPFAAAGVAVGAIKMLIERFRGGGR